MVLSFHQDSNQDLTSLRQFRLLPKQQKPVIAAVPAPSPSIVLSHKEKGSGKKPAVLNISQEVVEFM